MANSDRYKRTLDSLANLNLTSDQQQIQRRPLPPTSVSGTSSTRNLPLPPPPPPYNFSKNQKNSSPTSICNASTETTLPPYTYSKNQNNSLPSSIGTNPGYINIQQNTVGGLHSESPHHLFRHILLKNFKNQARNIKLNVYL